MKQCKHWPLDDSAKATGTDEEIAVEFRRMKDEIKQRVTDLINNLSFNLES